MPRPKPKPDDLWHAFVIPTAKPGDYDTIGKYDSKTHAVAKVAVAMQENPKVNVAILEPDGHVILDHTLYFTWPRLRGTLIRGRDADYVRVMLADSKPAG